MALIYAIILTEVRWRMKFQYFLSEKEGLLVVSLKGSLDDHQKPLVEKCLNEAVSKAPAGAILLMEGIADFPADGFRCFSLLLRGLKAKCKVVRVTGLKEKARKTLVDKGLLSASEFRETLADAAKEVAEQIKASNG